jgi:hypothetical protein
MRRTLENAEALRYGSRCTPAKRLGPPLEVNLQGSEGLGGSGLNRAGPLRSTSHSKFVCSAFLGIVFKQKWMVGEAC